MARPNSDAKAGYYPLSAEHLPGIASLISPGAGKILDPCAGEGTALQHLATAWTLTPYANELNHDRAASCREKFGALNAVQGDLRELRASRHAFSVLYCNPPYSHDATETRPDKRTELSLLKASWKWLQVEGVALWVVYDYHLRDNPHALKFLATHCSAVDVYKLPGLHLRTYQQIVVVGRKLHPTAVNYDDLETRTAALKATVDDAPDLVVHAKPVYQLPDPPNVQQFRFAPTKLTPEFALQAIQENGVHSSGRYQKLIASPPPETLERPITLPKAAQVLMLIVSGFTNGIILELPDGPHCDGTWKREIERAHAPRKQFLTRSSNWAMYQAIDRAFARLRCRAGFTLLPQGVPATPSKYHPPVAGYRSHHRCQCLAR